MTVRADIEAAFAAHKDDPVYRAELPPNLNRRNSPPPGNDMSRLTPAQLDRLETSLRHLPARIRAGAYDEPTLHDLTLELRQFRRAENNDRVLAGEYNGTDALPRIPMPFAARETHRPDRLPGSRQHAILRQALDDVDADDLREGLRERMGDDSSREPDPPTLRDVVAAATDLHAPETEESDHGL